MNRPADPKELLRQLKTLPLDEREQIAAELLEGIHDDGGEIDGDVESDIEFVEELERRADEALAHPERSRSAEETIAHARQMLAARRARRS